PQEEELIKLAGPDTEQEPQAGGPPRKTHLNGNSGESSQDSPHNDEVVRSKAEKEVLMSVSLPIEIINHDQTFPFLNTTLADLGIEESAVKERVVWVDTKRTQVRSKSGKLKEKEVTVLEVRVKAQPRGNDQFQEILYSTESHTDRAYCRSGVDILPWRNSQSAENGIQPVEMTLALDRQNQTEEKSAASNVK
uniref:Si:ch211-196f5.2 n=1 Tax=Astyanax mexicanus TaxID=7994 RepID=A0A8B9GXV4_ASTMX